MSEERRHEFYAKQGYNLRGYTEQLAWCSPVCAQNPKDVWMQTIFRLLYIGADLCASLRACVSATDEYEKRYHIKYLWVNLHEAYKAIYNNASDEDSYLAQFTAAYPIALQTAEYIEAVEQLERLWKIIMEYLRLPRNSYSHFDKDVCKTIGFLNDINSEEAPAHYCSKMMEIILLLTQMCRKFIPLGIQVPQTPKQVHILEPAIEHLRNLMMGKDKLIATMHEVFISASKEVKRGTCMCTLRDLVPGVRQMRSLKIWNAGMLIHILRADLAAALMSGMRSEQEFECRLNMRRIRIIRYEGLRQLKGMLTGLPDKAMLKQEIEGVLKALDSQDRNAAVHYRYGKIDYIPVAYTDCANPLETLIDLLDLEPFIRQLNKYQKGLV
ncbi:MAG: hypothetical protein IJV61_03290 [Paludibacteraceae bacterium]|nr:hypothetical protein [Paludibacteraceae bacterium]